MSESILPENAEQIDVTGATVPFYKYESEGITYFQFDTSMTGPPEPFINAVCGLKFVQNASTKLVMVNHKYPGGLFEKIGQSFDYEAINHPSGVIKVIFSYKEGASDGIDLSGMSCGGHG